MSLSLSGFLTTRYLLLMAVAFAFTAVTTTCERFTVFLVVYHTAYNKCNYNHQYYSYYNCSQHNYTSDNISFNYFVAFKSFLESTFNVLLSLYGLNNR